MRVVLGVSTVLGVLGVIAAFGLFFLAERVFHIDRPHIQTMMYLKLSVAGHLTIFLTRTRGPFWSIRPARILWVAVLGTQAFATCIALFGFGLVTPLAWYWALLVWGWALAWFLVNDRVKLLAYSVLDRLKISEATGATAPQRRVSAPPASGAKDGKADDAEPRPQANAEPVTDETKPQAEAKAEPTTDDAKPQLQANAEPATDDAKPAPETGTQPGATQPQAKSDVTTLLNRSLGDLLLAGLEKDPEDAGRIIAAALSQAEAPAAAKPDAETGPKAGTKAETRPKR
ncbi:MAG: hypothetical protein ABI056_03630, partial [Caulobacteraceae bacterium]